MSKASQKAAVLHSGSHTSQDSRAWFVLSEQPAWAAEKEGNRRRSRSGFGPTAEDMKQKRDSLTQLGVGRGRRLQVREAMRKVLKGSPGASKVQLMRNGPVSGEANLDYMGCWTA